MACLPLQITFLQLCYRDELRSVFYASEEHKICSENTPRPSFAKILKVLT